MVTNNNPSRVKAAERAHQVWEYRIAGWTYSMIAEKVGITPARISQILTRQMKESREQTTRDAEKLRELDLQRLERLFRQLFPEAMAGKLGAVDRCLQIIVQRSKLLGLDAPVRHTVITMDAIDEQIADLESQLRARGIDPAPPGAEARSSLTGSTGLSRGDEVPE